MFRSFLMSRCASVSGDFAADASGWYRADLVVDGLTFQLERYVADEPGIRAEPNSWAAWLETRANASEHLPLMERMIQRSDELDPVFHLIRLVDLPDQFQSADDLADRSGVLVTVRKASV
jgi:hypothetical protein